jgi:uncharacterized OB-fold protein
VSHPEPGGLPTPAPLVNVETKPFWDATLEGKLLLTRCNACNELIWYPRQFCPLCSSFDVGWVQAAGRGTIYSYTVNRRGQGEYRDLVYVLAYVELEEGPRMLTNIVDCDVESLAVGQAVEVVFHATGQGAALPRFRPVRPT